MAKYIDADTVVSMPFLDDSYGIEKHTMETDTIENLLDRFTKEGCPESADVAPVVRCWDCRYRVDPDKCCHPDGLLRRKDDGFCSYGERRDE